MAEDASLQGQRRSSWQLGTAFGVRSRSFIGQSSKVALVLKYPSIRAVAESQELQGIL